ncbi:META domain-containing protein [Oleiharenicola lentus]|uniref:META domain-containing protein n=1 Tax=Oleiharenicola lentus TaxID=2508720 RepID=UPI003F678086
MNASLKRLLTGTALLAGLLTAIFSAGCASPPPVNGNLSDQPALSNWHLTELYGDPVKTRPVPTLSLYASEGGKNVGNTGINSFSFEFVETDGKLKAGPITTTKMASSPEMTETEGVFLAALEEMTSWRIGPGTLEIISHQGVIAKFSKNPPLPPGTTASR